MNEVVVALLLVSLSSGCQYAKYSAQHTMCYYNGPGCQLKTRGVAKEDVRLILDEHNKYRQRVALGYGSNQPTAANMRQMEWDNELAALAQKWAEQCKTQHDCSDCRELPRFRVGQNIYMFASTADNATTDWQTASWEWFKEISIFSPHKIEPFQHPHAAGHYTQLAWANSYKVGCGYVYFYKGRWFTKLYICDYGPGGNILGDRMYIRGPACSACPAGTSCSSTYNGLCAASGSGAPAVTVPQTSWWTSSVGTSSFQPWWVVGGGAVASSTARPQKPNQSKQKVLLFCDFDAKGCSPETMGSSLWNAQTSSDRGTFYEAYVRRGNDAHLYVYTNDQQNDAGHGGFISKACLSFIYRKYPMMGRVSNDLEVAMWRHAHQGAYAEYIVSANALGWTNHRITVPAFSDVYSVSFHMIIPGSAGMAEQYVAVDGIRLTAGACNT